MKETENTTARETVGDEWDGLIANACYGWFGERPCEEAGVRDRAYIVSHRCTWYSYDLAKMIPGADIVEHGDLSVTVNGVRVPPGGAVTWTERRDVNAPYWEYAREAWNVQTWAPEQVLDIFSRQENGERAERHVFAPGVYTVAGNTGDAQQSLCSLSGDVQRVLCSRGGDDYSQLVRAGAGTARCSRLVRWRRVLRVPGMGIRGRCTRPRWC